MDQSFMHRRTLLGKALVGTALLLGKTIVPAAARPVPPYQRGESAFTTRCRGIQDKYKEMEQQAKGETDRSIRELIEADMKKVELEWILAGCSGEYDNIATAKLPPIRPGASGSWAIAPGSSNQQVVMGGGKPTNPAVAPGSTNQQAVLGSGSATVADDDAAPVAVTILGPGRGKRHKRGGKRRR